MKSARTPCAGAVLFSMFVLGVVHAPSAFAAGKIKRPQSHPPTVIADASLRCRGGDRCPFQNWVHFAIGIPVTGKFAGKFLDFTYFRKVDCQNTLAHLVTCSQIP